jgi:hypothetical protein
MGFFDKARTFFEASNMVSLEFLEVEGVAPGEVRFPLGDSAIKGRYRVTGLRDCVVVRHIARMCSRMPEKDGSLGTVIAEETHDAQNAVIGLGYTWPYPLRAGQTVEDGFCIVQIDLPAQLRRYGLAGVDPRVEFFVKVVIDVQGSPFDPEFEQRITVG